MNINLISKYPPTVCGIADYSERLAESLKRFEDAHLEKIAIQHPSPLNPLYYIKLLNGAEKTCIAHIQFEYGLFAGPISVNILKCFISSCNVLSLLLYLKFKKHKAVITMHFVSDPCKKIIFDKIERMMCRLSDRIIVPCLESKKRLLRTNLCKVNEAKIVHIPLGCQLPKHVFYDMNESKKICGAPDKKILLSCGFIAPYKNIHFSVSALKELPDEVVLFVVGRPNTPADFKYRDKIENQVKCLKLEKRVIFRGYLEETALSLMFSASDIILMPYTDVNQSAVFDMAMGYRKPVLCSDLPYFRDIKEQFDCLELTGLNNRKQFIGKILFLLNDKERRNTLETNCGNYARFNSMDKIAEKHAEVYKTLG